jgi:L-aspartate oxidase
MKRPLNVLVVGSGIAGMSYAIELAGSAIGRNVRIRLLSKAPVHASSSYAAQGGVAAVMDARDSFDGHVEDTLMVGGGRNEPKVVDRIVREGPHLVNKLIAMGASFDADVSGRLHLSLEGGHSAARVVHHEDRTGAEIVRVLRGRVRALPMIEVWEGWQALDLLVQGEHGQRRCAGLSALEQRTGTMHTLQADLVVLATGGVGQVYQHTTNPTASTGDGIAMAVRAGVPLRDMAFVQFHPTAMYTGTSGQAFLISEAVRGAGARLLCHDGKPLMDGLHAMGDLAPRNVVARAIHREMERSGTEHVWLDLAPVGAARFAREFPAIDRRCGELGLRPVRDLLPVMPAAHYLCGGIATDDRGRTGLPGLLALGECAGSGSHGADRLASNSLLEAMVIAMRAAAIAPTYAPSDGPITANAFAEFSITGRTHASIDRAIRDLRHAMTCHVGVVRDRDGLACALRTIAHAELVVARRWVRRRLSDGLFNLRDMTAVARVITEAALAEPRSVGTHFLADEVASPEHRSSPSTKIQARVARR